MWWPSVNSFIFQDFIEQDKDNDYVSSYRILVGGTGQIFAGAMICRDKSKPGLVLPNDLFGELSQPNSKWYIGEQQFCSNIVQGGVTYPLKPSRRPHKPADWHTVLENHDISPDTVELPPAVINLARRIGQTVAPKTDLLLGVDFMRDTTGRHWYLESNTGPSLDTYLACHNRSIAHLAYFDSFRAAMVEALYALG